MKTKYLQNDGGLSLLEVLIGMIVLAIGLLGLSPLLVVSIEGNVMSHDNTIAANLAKEQVEFYDAMDVLPALPFTQNESGLEGGLYSRTTYIRNHDTDASVPEGVIQIDVQVSWTDNSEIQRSTNYSTYLVE